MTINKMKKLIVLLIGIMLLSISITALASGRVEDEYTISGNTKVLGSAYIIGSGFGNHTGNGAASIVGSDKDAASVYCQFHFGSKVFKNSGAYSDYSYIIGYTGKYSYIQSYEGKYNYVTTKIGTQNNSEKYITVTSRD